MKLGVALAKTARKLGRLPGWLDASLADAFQEGIRWTEIGGVRSLDDMRGIANTRVLKPKAEIIEDIGRMRSAIGIPSSIDLLSKTNSAQEL